MPLCSQITLAGRKVFLEKINPRDQDCTSFRSKARIPMPDEVVEHPGGLVKFANPRDQDCTSFRSKARIPMPDEVVEHPGGLVKFAIPYSDNHGRHLGDVTQEDVDEKNRVYHCKHFASLNL